MKFISIVIFVIVLLQLTNQNNLFDQKVSPLVKKHIISYVKNHYNTIDIMIMLEQADLSKIRFDGKSLDELDHDTKGHLVYHKV
jgi:hypothetical protein